MPPADRAALLKSVAETIVDYRRGEIDAPTPEHVERWVSQFDGPVQMPILTEMNHVLSRSYFSRSRVGHFLTALVKNPKLVGENPREFWKNTGLLNIQKRGASQREMLDMFDGVLQNELSLCVRDCSGASGNFAYIDDALFSGNRLKIDLLSWVKEAPPDAHLSVIVIACHAGAPPYVSSAVQSAVKTLGKKIDIAFWRCIGIENRLFQRDTSEVLWPTRIPNDPRAQAYADALTAAGHPPQFRQVGAIRQSQFYSSEEGRDVLEQEFLKAGARIRAESPNLIAYQRPLGNSVLQTLGFGALVVTFRNCPNSCPLAFWASDPWYPLFPRKSA